MLPLCLLAGGLLLKGLFTRSPKDGDDETADARLPESYDPGGFGARDRRDDGDRQTTLGEY